MSSSNAWEVIKAWAARIQWLLISAITVAALGWLNHDQIIEREWSRGLTLLTVALVLAFIAGIFPVMAPYNPEKSKNFWKVTSMSFKLFVVLIAIVYFLFSLNSG
jgi:UDP-N-acetylmuramyl pentapeptide phosphotransferase/UDP-N-acetylglucosamine-1-phosphate transferase